MSTNLVLGGLALVFISYVALICIGVSQLEKRKGRDLTFMEAAAFGMCFPYSLLIVFFIADDRPTSGDTHG